MQPDKQVIFSRPPAGGT